MNVQIDQLVKSLLRKDSLEQCSVEELQQFANRHPYFGAAQLLLTRKLQTENPEQYEVQLQKTFLFFHNPLWVEHLLNDTGNGKSSAIETANIARDSGIKNESAVSGDVPVAVINSSTVNELPPDLPLPFLPIEKPVITDEKEPELVITGDGIAKIPAIKKEAGHSNSEGLIFEPYHTVDYFASQGIKFREEERPKDKFGQQLKSFTDWLKTMKRLSVSEIVKATETNVALKVEELAEHSLAEREVVTEAMAEVWEKQGNALKAIEVYTKLSLLDPSKSRYFASKIEGLKKIN